MIAAVTRNLETDLFPPSPRAILMGALKTDLIALCAIIVISLLTIGLSAFGVDITASVTSHMNDIADALIMAGPGLLGWWLLYAFLYVFAAALMVSVLGPSRLAGATWVRVTRLLPFVFSRIAFAWHHRPIPFHLLCPAGFLRCISHDCSAYPVASGWRPGLYPSLTYESPL